jgi:DNA-binding NarL/FixJ family response regulator
MKTTTKLPRLAIIEDEPLFANMLCDSLERTEQFTLTGWYQDGTTAIEDILQNPPDAIIADVILTGEMTGLEVGTTLRDQLPELGIVILSGTLDIALIESLDPNYWYGWSFLDKRSVRDIDSIICAVNAVIEGNVAIDKFILPSSISTAYTDRSNKNRVTSNTPLTKRQQEIISLVAQGYTNSAIAERLFISERTVEHHLSTIYTILGVYATDTTKHPRVEAVLNWLKTTTLVQASTTPNHAASNNEESIC